ncbi:hypothetical protein [Mycolicibacterium sp. BiH015]|uniref:hypothetical protein n=1 Tax=Mycolicibacterium sp. BiH015 TaxID=3018808 RepID=UPI0022E0355E|nr:hypothetical protein [Mycolicibacterium sp. BiH015]
MRPDEPLITDLDTGITYGTDWHFRALTGYRPGTVQDLPVEHDTSLAVHSVLVGTVVRTRVATIGSGDSLFQQTTLVVEPAG